MAKSNATPSSDPKATLEQRFRDGEITFDQLREEMANLDAGQFECEIGNAGGLVLKFPNGRFPVNFFYEWAKAIFFNQESIDRIKAFMDANKGKFKTKEDRLANRKK